MNKGFTIIETLVAITILMIAISGPLVVANKGTTGAITARDSMIASYLAQESMETIKNLRDNNIATAASWLNGFSVGSVCNAANKPCDASALDSPAILNNLTTPYPLVLVPNGYYSHNTATAGAVSTKFSRYFYLSAPGGATPCIEASSECTATVIVSWNEGVVPYNVTISSELVNAQR